MTALGAETWENWYRTGETGWDIGRPAPPLARWLAAHPPKGKRALVPGCGRGHDARALAAAGAEVTAVDISPLALDEAQRLEPALSARISWVRADVRRLPGQTRGAFDMAVEHTCFCALPPPDRGPYLDEIKKALKPGGLLVGLFYVDFDNPQGPPFGIFQKDLRPLLESRFAVLSWEGHPADSEPRRLGKEALVICRTP